MSPRKVVDFTIDVGYSHIEGETLACDLCPRNCRLKDGDRGFCFVRQNQGGQMKLTTYGLSTGFCIDPVEKKPLNHFYPGSPVLSFGTAGCNLGCQFCQNWTISKSREVEILSEPALPEQIARAARHYKCAAVAFTYNDPVIWAEYAIDTAIACHAADIKTIAVTAGYINDKARSDFYAHIDAANVDLKAFSQHFYSKLTLSNLAPVLDTLVWLKHESQVWFEITTLIIPGENDSDQELHAMCQWIYDKLGADVPLHFSAFHPDFRLLDYQPTSKETLVRAREIAVGHGLKYVYVGNVDDSERQNTYCPACSKLLIERNWYELGQYKIKGGACAYCAAPIAGVFPAKRGSWGRKRQPVSIQSF